MSEFRNIEDITLLVVRIYIGFTYCLSDLIDILICQQLRHLMVRLNDNNDQNLSAYVVICSEKEIIHSEKSIVYRSDGRLRSSGWLFSFLLLASNIKSLLLGIAGKTHISPITMSISLSCLFALKDLKV